MAENALHLPSVKAADRVTLINTVPSAIAELLKIEGIPPSVRTINLAGEALSNTLVQQLYELPHVQKVFNLYGPSEDTTYSTFALIPKGSDTIPAIGRPISNTQCFVLDDRLQLVPQGVPGELYIGGDGLARGYLNRPDLTASKFISNPFSQSTTDRLYKTGDLVRYKTDGNLEYLGRLDNQVKLRGFRIELGEIEAVLSQHPNLESGIVAVREDNPGDKHLVAYLVAKLPLKPTLLELRSFLSQQLPEYMIPLKFVWLDKLPLTPNGKVDRAALPAPEKELSAAIDRCVPPRDIWELQLVNIWKNLFHTKSISIKDSFFNLGGHSLLSVSLMAQIQKQMGLKLPLTLLFQNTTIEQLATVLRHQHSSVSTSPLVEIKTGSSARPFFCIHPVGGNVLSYFELANCLNSDLSVYGLQSRGLDGKDRPLTCIEDMAASYIKAIQTVQPIGPYWLGGWSMGGAIAFEMAIQLEKQGEKISFLGLMDSWIPKPNPQNSTDCVNETEMLCQFAKDLGLRFGKNLLDSPETFQDIPASEQIDFILQQAQVKGILPTDVETAQFYPLIEVFKTNLQALKTYIPQTYSGKITLFRASELLWSELPETSLDWNKLGDRVEIHTVVGNHYSMLNKPYFYQLSEHLKRYLKS